MTGFSNHAILAGLEEAVHDGTDRVLLLDDRQMRLALAVHCTVAKRVAAPSLPGWLSPLLKSRPEARLISMCVVDVSYPKT